MEQQNSLCSNIFFQSQFSKTKVSGSTVETVQPPVSVCHSASLEHCLSLVLKCGRGGYVLVEAARQLDRQICVLVLSLRLRRP